MKKEIGFVGLGRMGFNMVSLLREKDFTVVGYNQNTAPYGDADALQVQMTASLEEMVSSLSTPRVVWLMVPSSAVDSVLLELVPLLNAGDTVIDGGNSFYKDSIRRHTELKEKSIGYLDCGTSGGMTGARHGAAIMVGGLEKTFAAQEHLIAALATEGGYARVGNEGAGHFVKMIHNGIEYGMMGAIAEGVTILHEHEGEMGINLQEVFKPYEHESIITSKLVSWLVNAYKEGQIELIEGIVPKGETEEEMEHITTLGETLVLKAALQQRKKTRETPSYLGKLVAAMRNQFGGHKVIVKE
jgi:6-phosphogluconate dehydrogenase